MTTPPPRPQFAACRVAWQTHSWQAGYTALLRVTVIGGSVDGWTLRFTTPRSDQRLVQGWSATWWQTGMDISAQDAGWNARIPSGGSVDIGFNGSHQGEVGRPNAFVLNGVVCEQV
ncbi:cellulose binding domain-containing protein [Cellulomonas sp. JZ18]|uniref:cellulose binding domain-containing protein n=1 Tax=Cellulomonas sp. JZ18 TaxID=2654191 RepID=UPI001E587626|nr:cellulose binding domain-containing protein [Cellulomonas sp. JZ18]